MLGDTPAEPSVPLLPHLLPHSRVENGPFDFTSSVNKVSSAISDYHRATIACQSYPAWSIFGKISNRGSSSLILWGKATSSDAPPSAEGWQLEDGNIIVNHPNLSGIVYEQYHGLHYFIGMTQGTNAFGAKVPCKVYGDFPRAYYEAVNNREKLAKRVAILAHDLETSVIESCNVTMRSNHNKTTYQRSAQRCLATGDFLAKHNMDSGVLEANAVIDLSEAAILAAKSGDLNQSSTILQQAFAVEEPTASIGVGNEGSSLYEPFSSQSPSTTANSLYISGLATLVYARHSDIVHRLLVVWNDCLPNYLAHKPDSSVIQNFTRQLITTLPHTSSDEPVISNLFFILPYNGKRGMLGAGTIAPDFAVRTQSGETSKLSQFSGKVVIVVFFDPLSTMNTRTLTPGKPLEHINTVVRRFSGDDVAYLPIATSLDQLSAIARAEPEYQIYIDWGEIHYATELGLGAAREYIFLGDGIPYLYVIDRNGKIVNSVAGDYLEGSFAVNFDEGEVVRLVKTALLEQKTSAASQTISGLGEKQTNVENIPTIEHQTSPFPEDASEKPAPDFQATSPTGKLVALKDLRGRVVIVHFFNHWFEATTPTLLDHINRIAPNFDSNQVTVLPISDGVSGKVTGFVSLDEWKTKHPLNNLTIYTANYDKLYEDKLVVIGKDGNIAGVVPTHYLGTATNDKDFDDEQLFGIIKAASKGS